MWIATKYGFFSIVKNMRKKEEPEVQIRARNRGDLEKLRRAFIKNWQKIHGEKPKYGTKNFPLILDTPEADYKHRMIVNIIHLVHIMSLICTEIDYPNFKDMIHDTPDQKDKSLAYSEMWWSMFNYQNGETPFEYAEDSGNWG